MNSFQKYFLTCLCVATIFWPAFSYAQSTLTNIGTLGGNTSNGGEISYDGSTLVGSSNNGAATHAYYWTQGGGMVDIGTLGGTNSSGVAISADNNTIVGTSSITGDTASHAYSWTLGGGMVDIGTLGGDSSSARDVSGDGSIVVGNSYIAGNADFHAFSWTLGGGIVDLGTLGGTFSDAQGISGDGSVITGYYDVGGSIYHAFRWTQGTGMVGLSTLGGSYSTGVSVSYDGSTITGSSDITGNTDTHAFIWTQAGGMVDIGSLGGDFATGTSLSSDGSIVGGQSRYPTGGFNYHAFLWTQADGIRDFNTIMTDAGINLTNIRLTDIKGIANDGMHFSVTGTNTITFDNIAYLAYYNPAVGAGITTAEAQAQATDKLATTQQASQIGTRSVSNILLGSIQPMRDMSDMSSGATFGSALGHAQAEYHRHRITVLGGIGYGTQEYENTELHEAPTFAGALRYSFGDLNEEGIVPFIEGGGSISPFQEATFSRPYANGAGIAMGKGTTDTTQGLWYGRAGLAWNVTEDDQLTGFGELGKQYLSFDGYTEAQTGSNPFPASIDSGTSSMNVARAGGSWSHEINDIFGITLSGALARSFNVDSDLTATVSGIGTMKAADEQFTWGEYGARLETHITDSASLNFTVNGTAGGSDIDNATHGGVSVSYKF